MWSIKGSKTAMLVPKQIENYLLSRD